MLLDGLLFRTIIRGLLDNHNVSTAKILCTQMIVRDMLSDSDEVSKLNNVIKKVFKPRLRCNVYFSSLEL